MPQARGRLILAAHPDVTVVLSDKMPAYKVGRRRLHVGAWQHGLSLYGWPQDAAAIADDELLALIGAALGS